MKKVKSIKLLKLFVLITFIFFTFGIVFITQLETVIQNQINTANILVLFFIILLIELTPQPIGPELFLLSTFLLGYNYLLIVIMNLLATSLSTIIHYKIGKVSYDYVCDNGMCDKQILKFNKFGKYALFLSAIGPIPYVPLCWISGSIKMNMKTYLTYGLLSRFLRIIVVSTIIYGFF